MASKSVLKTRNGLPVCTACAWKQPWCSKKASLGSGLSGQNAVRSLHGLQAALGVQRPVRAASSQPGSSLSAQLPLRSRARPCLQRGRGIREIARVAKAAVANGAKTAQTRTVCYTSHHGTHDSSCVTEVYAVLLQMHVEDLCWSPSCALVAA